ncbi:MAG: NfeD family protein [Lachnospiraceae bacterium]|nr:NfeD family protein [Lachnospiraceae bacterium]
MEAYYWFGIAAALAVIELATLGLTTIWFAAGALLAGFLNLAGFGLGVQLGVFVLISLVLLVVTRPLASKYVNAKTQKTNADSLIGEICLITKAIDNLKGEGQAVVKGQEWTARSKDGTPIAEGKKVRITEIQGVKLIVEPEEE